MASFLCGLRWVDGILLQTPCQEAASSFTSATRFELGGPKGALRFDEATPSPGGRATAAAQGTAAGGSASAPGSTLGGSDGNDGASAAVAWQAVTAARLALRRWREGPGWCCSRGLRKYSKSLLTLALSVGVALLARSRSRARSAWTGSCWLLHFFRRSATSVAPGIVSNQIFRSSMLDS